MRPGSGQSTPLAQVAWSATGSARTDANPPANGHSFTSSQSWSWPYRSYTPCPCCGPKVGKVEQVEVEVEVEGVVASGAATFNRPGGGSGGSVGDAQQDQHGCSGIRLVEQMEQHRSPGGLSPSQADGGSGAGGGWGMVRQEHQAGATSVEEPLGSYVQHHSSRWWWWQGGGDGGDGVSSHPFRDVYSDEYATGGAGGSGGAGGGGGEWQWKRWWQCRCRGWIQISVPWKLQEAQVQVQLASQVAVGLQGL